MNVEFCAYGDVAVRKRHGALQDLLNGIEVAAREAKRLAAFELDIDPKAYDEHLDSKLDTEAAEGHNTVESWALEPDTKAYVMSFSDMMERDALEGRNLDGLEVVVIPPGSSEDEPFITRITGVDFLGASLVVADTEVPEGASVHLVHKSYDGELSEYSEVKNAHDLAIDVWEAENDEAKGEGERA